jgi:hypothetical protein
MNYTIVHTPEETPEYGFAPGLRDKVRSTCGAPGSHPFRLQYSAHYLATVPPRNLSQIPSGDSQHELRLLSRRSN